MVLAARAGNLGTPHETQSSRPTPQETHTETQTLPDHICCTKCKQTVIHAVSRLK